MGGPLTLFPHSPNEASQSCQPVLQTQLRYHRCASVSPSASQSSACTLGALFSGVRQPRAVLGTCGDLGGAPSLSARGVLPCWWSQCRNVGLGGPCLVGARGQLGPSAVGRSGSVQNTLPWSCWGCCWRWLGWTRLLAWVNLGGAARGFPWVAVLGRGIRGCVWLGGLPLTAVPPALLPYVPRVAPGAMPGKVTATTFVLERPRCIFDPFANASDAVWLAVAFADGERVLQWGASGMFAPGCSPHVCAAQLPPPSKTPHPAPRCPHTRGCPPPAPT